MSLTIVKDIVFKLRIFIIPLVIFLIIISLITSNNTTYKSSLIEVEKVSPENSTALVSKEKPIFTIIFNRSISVNNLNIKISKEDLSNVGLRNPVSFEAINKAESEVTITLQEETEASSIYIIEIYIQNKLILEKKYLTAQPLPKKQETNNQQLKKYLPHDTDSYRLSYSEDKNLYFFNFKYNPESKDNLETQYNKAKSDAEKYIKAKV